jgi:serine/threonine protein kinase/Tol biopolymer transport system component
MPLPAGTKLGPYDVVAPLGAGGMGEVYRATDTRLKRQVAVKILPPDLAADPERLARFQREAEVLASLNHPHIAAIYGLEDAAGVKALVMELIEGPTLADRIAQGPIPIDEAIPIAKQIAEALEAAHEKGIIHRDLKPANIKVREDGVVKVLDFGLAKLTERNARDSVSGSDLAESPTLTRPMAMTGVNVILGTAAYMSPEQARGRAVDKRTDVWAYGVVLYEMLTGARAFEGEDITEMIASVVKSTPNWTALPADVPQQVVTLIQRCLEKDKNARIGDLSVARYLLTDHASSGPPPDATVVTKRPRQRLPWIIAAVAVLSGALTGWLLPRRSNTAHPVMHLQMNVAPADRLVGSNASVRPSRTAMAISPDGRWVAFTALQAGATQLYARELDRADATPVRGTEGAAAPFFSADGAWIGFWADNKIKKVPTTGGPISTICDVQRPEGASWAEDGTIFFSNNAGISKVSSDGGTPVTITTPAPNKGERHLLPQSLPGGKAILFTIVDSNGWDTANVVLYTLANREQRVLIPGGADARYLSTGHLLYMKSATLMTAPFDVSSRKLTGPPVPMVEDVMRAINAPNSYDETGAGQFAVSASGTLLYITGGINRNLESSWVWVDRTGVAQPLPAVPPGPYLFPRLSPNGQKVAVTVKGAPPEIWIYDLLRGAPTRLTFEGGNRCPIWSPDGKRIVYNSRTTGVNSLYTIAADGSGKPERLASSDYSQSPSSWSSTTNSIAYLQRPQSGSYGIWILPMEGDRKPRLFLESRFELMHAEFSSDGRWIAYVSRESGGWEVYVQPYPGPGEKIRISTTGGYEPLWAPNGRELLYRGGPNMEQFLSVAIRAFSPFQADAPHLLFQGKPGEYDLTAPVRSWNVSADGKRFLLSRFVESKDKPVSAINVVVNWAEELKRLAPKK